MDLIEDLKALPKEYAIILVLKILVGLMALVGLTTCIMVVVVGYLYVHAYSFAVIIFAAFAVWLVLLLILALAYYFRLKTYRRDALVLRKLASKEAVSSIAAYILSKLVHRLKRIKPAEEKI
jgi:hypothetical protein